MPDDGKQERLTAQRTVAPGRPRPSLEGTFFAE
jgi:hypothetical protein